MAFADIHGSLTPELRSYLDQQDQARRVMLARSSPQPAATPQASSGGDFITGLLPSGGGIAGAVAGGAAGTAIAPGVGTLIGALLGGALGGGGGKVAENAIENKDLGQGVLQEAAINGVLGAGPLRLGKAAVDVGRGIKPAQGLADAILNAGEKKAATGITGVAGTVNKAATEAAQKGFGIDVGASAGRGKIVTPDKADALQEFITNGAQKYGGIRAGRPLDQANDAQSVFNNVTRSLDNTLNTIDRPVKKTEINALIKSARDSITSNPAVTNKAATLEKFVTNIKSAKTLKELEAIRRQADDIAYTSTGAGKTSAAAQAHAVRDAIDQFITPLSSDYKAVKGDYQLARDALESTSKASRNARGVNVPFIGDIGAQEINGARNRVASVAGNLTNGGAGAVAGNPYGVGRVAGRVLPGNAIADPIMGLAGQGQSEGGPGGSAPGMPADLTSALMQAGQGPDAGGAGGMPQDYNPYPRENLMADLQRDPKNAEKYIAQYEALSKIFGPEAQPQFSSATAGTIADMSKGLQTLQDLTSLVGGGDYAGGVVQGNLRQFNPLDNQFKEQQALIDASRQIVGKALEGGVLRKEDEEKYKKILPTLQDSREVALAKLNYISGVISQNLQQYRSLVGAGDSPSTLEEALMGQSAY